MRTFASRVHQNHLPCNDRHQTTVCTCAVDAAGNSCCMQSGASWDSTECHGAFGFHLKNKHECVAWHCRCMSLLLFTHGQYGVCRCVQPVCKFVDTVAVTQLFPAPLILHDTADIVQFPPGGSAGWLSHHIWQCCVGPFTLVSGFSLGRHAGRVSFPGGARRLWWLPKAGPASSIDLLHVQGPTGLLEVLATSCNYYFLGGACCK